MSELDPATADIVNRLRDINNRIDDLEQTREHLRAQLRDALPVGTHTIGGAKAVTVTTPRRFDPDTAARVLPPGLLELCTVSRVDPAAARQNLPPALFEQCMTSGGKPVVRLA